MLGANWMSSRAPQDVPTKTGTPFKFQLLATETMIPTLAAETVELTDLPLETSSSTDRGAGTTPFLHATEQSGSTTGESFTPTPTITLDPIFSNAEPLLAGIYDESDVGFTYIGSWDTEENVDAHREAIAVSDTMGDYVAFSFTGNRIGLGYQSSDDAGEITVNIDGFELIITQLVGDYWLSDEYEPGTHYVIINHTAAGQINMDYVEIYE